MLEGSGVTTDGQQFTFLWKAWMALPPVALKWEVKRVLPAVGFKETSKNTKLNDTIMNDSSTSGMEPQLGAVRLRVGRDVRLFAAKLASARQLERLSARRRA